MWSGPGYIGLPVIKSGKFDQSKWINSPKKRNLRTLVPLESEYSDFWFFKICYKSTKIGVDLVSEIIREM